VHFTGTQRANLRGGPLAAHGPSSTREFRNIPIPCGVRDAAAHTRKGSDMHTRRFVSRFQTPREAPSTWLLAAFCGASLWTASCATPQADGARAPKSCARHDNAATPIAIDPESAAAIALAHSPRVEAARRRFDAASARKSMSSLPPDPTIALSLGIPVDGLGGTGLSGSISAAIAWLFTRDAEQRQAEASAESAAQELVWTARSVAAEARAAARSAALARRAQDAAEAAVRASSARDAALAAAADALDVPRTALLDAQSETMALKAELERREADCRLAARALESILSVRGSSEICMEKCLAFAEAERASAAEPSTIDAPAPITIESIRATREVADARAALARTESPFAPSTQVSAGFAQDLEDRRSVETGLSITVPLFRRDAAREAARQDLAAAEAELAETIRVASLAHAEAIERVRSTRSALVALRTRRTLADGALDAARAASLEGEHSTVQLAAAEIRAARAHVEELDGALELAGALAAIERLQQDTAESRMTAEGTAP